MRIMDPVLRPRRSVLFMPGANQRALEKAKSLPCDGIIIDLEDAVAPDAKVTARSNAVAAVESRSYGYREVVVRVNGMDTPWYADDLAAAVAARPDGIAVPKVSSADQVRRIAADLDAAGADPQLAIWAMIETPQAVLVKELHSRHVSGRAPLTTALQLCVLAARAAGVIILDGVYNDVRDAEGFAVQVNEAVLMGFDGKTLIHPSQVAPANDGFAPSPAEVEDARALIAAWQEGNGGVATYRGRMIEQLHVDEAERALAMADAIAGRDQG